MLKILLLCIALVCCGVSNADISVQQIAFQVNQNTSYQGSPSINNDSNPTNGMNLTTPSQANQQSAPQSQGLQNYWELVLIFRSTCPYCQQFDPVITDFAKQSGFDLIAFSTDGGTLPGLTNVLPATQAILAKFYTDKIPAVYLVQKNTMQIIPISQGVITEQDLAARIQNALSQAGAGQ